MGEQDEFEPLDGKFENRGVVIQHSKTKYTTPVTPVDYQSKTPGCVTPFNRTLDRVNDQVPTTTTTANMSMIYNSGRHETESEFLIPSPVENQGTQNESYEIICSSGEDPTKG